MRLAAFFKMGSKQAFAAVDPNVCFADEATAFVHL